MKELVKITEQNEIWLPIKGYEGLYEVSRIGVKRLGNSNNKKEKHIKPTFKLGYPCVRLSKENISKSFRIHRLVAIAFIPNPENKKCVNHINAIKTDFNPENLEWCTHKENTAHLIENKKHLIGINNPSAKLDLENVIEIRKLLKEGLTQKTIAKKYGLNQTTISRINLNKIWKEVA